MIFTLVVKVPFGIELTMIKSVDFMLLDMNIAVDFVFPESDQIRGLSHLYPIILVEIVGIPLAVAHIL